MKCHASAATLALLIIFLFIGARIKASALEDTTYLRISIHVFADTTGSGNFNPDSASHITFLQEMVGWINHRLTNLDTLQPLMPSSFIGTTGLQVRVDSIFYHRDQHGWDCSEEIDSDYMRTFYVNQDTTLSFQQKFQTLPIFIGSNYPLVGGHNSLIGDKRYIAMRGIYSEFLTRPYPDAVRDCGRGLLHELGHSLGLSHNFKGGSHGEQCDECEDNGCPEEGSSNNIMDYWPSFGYALSACQLDIIRQHLKGERGTISEVILNDSCYSDPDIMHIIMAGTELLITDTTYLHGDMLVEKGARLTVEGYLSFPEGKGMIVEPGAEVFLINGSLGNLCGDLWKGIRYIRDSINTIASGGLILQDGVIENARTGILTNCMESIQLVGMTFRNNLLSLEITGDEDEGVGGIDSCLFEINRRINHWEAGEYPAVFVKLGGDANVRFKNCHFVNQEGHRTFEDDKSGIGILNENAILELKSCSFNNLFKGIYATGNDPDHAFLADSCKFEYCHCGIQLNNFTRASIRYCTFSLNRLNTMPSIGIYANSVLLLDVRENIFNTDYGGDQLVGMISNHSVPGTHFIESNLFEGLHTGILITPGQDLPEWPQSLLSNSLDELLNLPIGTVWLDNQFIRVDQEYVKIFPDGHGLATGSLKEYALFDVATSKEYPIGGFGPFALHQNYFSFILPPYPMENTKGDMLFFALSDSSWVANETPSLTLETYPMAVADLLDSWGRSKELPASGSQLTHEGLILLTQHLESYPWLAVDPSFKEYIFDRINIVPGWFWDKIQEALSQKDPWKMRLHELIIFLARHQRNKQEPISTFLPIVNIDSTGADYKQPIDYKSLPDLRKLNIGLISESHLPRFSIVPNPNSGKFGIHFNQGNFAASGDLVLDYGIRKTTGQLVIKGKILNISDLLFDIRPAAPGSYLLEIWSAKEFLGMQKFIILPD